MNTQKLICPLCKYSKNLPSAKKCELCGTSLHALSINKSNSSSAILDSSIRSQKLSVLENKINIKAEKIAQKYLQFIIIGLAIGLTAGIGGSLILRERDRTANNTQQEDRTNESTRDSVSKPQTEKTFSEVENVPSGTFWYGSSIPFSPLHTAEILNDINEAFPDFKTLYQEPPAYTKPGSSTSVAMLLDGAVSFAELSRPLKDSEYAKAKERGIALQQIPIASDGIVFFVHPSLPVDRLTLDQVRKMILGEITNWQQVGGSDLPIVPFVFDPKIAPSTLLLLFDKAELEMFSQKAQYVRDYTDAIRKVGATPGGISYASAAIIANQRSVQPLLLARKDSEDYINPFTRQRKINTYALQNGNYPLMRRFFIGVRQDGTIDEQAGLAYANIWLSKPGQKLVEKAGFVPIK